MKRLVKPWLPPVILSFYRSRWKKGICYEGNYSSWQSALNHSVGYDSDLILEKVSSALLKVKMGEAVYERDSVLFDRIEYPFPLLSGLLRAAVANAGELRVLDFGGSLGSIYFQCREFLSAVTELKWCIVEQEKFVARGRELFETDQLRFFYSMQECMENIRPNVILFPSVLQYLEQPFHIMSDAISTGAAYIIIDRTPFSTLSRDKLCVQHVPPQIYQASYPCWIFGEQSLHKKLISNYNLVAEFDSLGGCGYVDNSDQFCYKGSIWEKR